MWRQAIGIGLVAVGLLSVAAHRPLGRAKADGLVIVGGFDETSASTWGPAIVLVGGAACIAGGAILMVLSPRACDSGGA